MQLSRCIFAVIEPGAALCRGTARRPGAGRDHRGLQGRQLHVGRDEERGLFGPWRREDVDWPSHHHTGQAGCAKGDGTRTSRPDYRCDDQAGRRHGYLRRWLVHHGAEQERRLLQSWRREDLDRPCRRDGARAGHPAHRADSGSEARGRSQACGTSREADSGRARPPPRRSATTALIRRASIAAAPVPATKA